ncbi:MAG TPA: response regulator, partial [Allocoleopsis sp.]
MTKRVLIIDDDEDIRVIARASLMLIAALEVSEASSAQEGFEKAIAEQPDAILLDVMMPGT